MRNKTLVRLVRDWVGKRVPDYVFRETIYRALCNAAHFVKYHWSLEVLNLSLLDFNPDTQRRILERQFGDVEFAGTDRDLERMALQREVARKVKPGDNEPIIVCETMDGWELVEGWHRTMARLPRDGTSQVLLRAWVGRLPPP
jgi:hypothetical protein